MSDRRSVEVPAGFKAIDAVGGQLVAQPQSPRTSAPNWEGSGYWTGALSQNGQWLVTTSYVKGEVELRDGKTGEVNKIFRAHEKRVTAAAFSPDGPPARHREPGWDPQVLGYGGRSPGFPPTERGGRNGRFVFRRWPVAFCVVLDESSGERVLSSWHLDTLDSRWPALRLKADHWTFSPGGGLFAATRRQERTVALWDMHTGQPRAPLTETGTPFAGALRNVFSLAFSHDNGTLAIDGSSGLVTLWDTSSGRLRSSFQRQGGRIYGMTFSRDDRWLATGHQDGTTRLWNAREDAAAPRAVFGGHHLSHAHAIGFSPITGFSSPAKFDSPPSIPGGVAPCNSGPSPINHDETDLTT